MQCLAWLHSCRGVELWSCQPGHRQCPRSAGSVLPHAPPPPSPATTQHCKTCAGACPGGPHLSCTPPLHPSCCCWPGPAPGCCSPAPADVPWPPGPLLTPDSSDTARVPRHRRARPASPRGGRRLVWRHGTSCISAAAACTRLSVSAVLGPVRHVCPTTPQQ